MKNVQHAQGQWVVTRRTPCQEHDPLFTIDVADADGGLLEMVASVGTLWSEPEKAQATAQLLAAAPELLEALKMFVWPYQEADRHTDTERREIARAVIAKATGEA